jgi:hypothetical protein
MKNQGLAAIASNGDELRQCYCGLGALASQHIAAGRDWWWAQIWAQSASQLADSTERSKQPRRPGRVYLDLQLCTKFFRFSTSRWATGGQCPVIRAYQALGRSDSVVLPSCAPVWIALSEIVLESAPVFPRWSRVRLEASPRRLRASEPLDSWIATERSRHGGVR